MRIKKKQIVDSFARLLALGRESGAVSTRHIEEEVKFLARLTGEDGVGFLLDVSEQRNELLKEKK